MSLKLLKLFVELVDAIKAFLRMKRLKELDEAKEAALKSGDQRKLEEALGGSAPASTDHNGVYTRPHKKKQE